MLTGDGHIKKELIPTAILELHGIRTSAQMIRHVLKTALLMELIAKTGKIPTVLLLMVTLFNSDS